MMKGRLMSVWAPLLSSHLAFSAASLSRCRASLSLLRSIPCASDMDLSEWKSGLPSGLHLSGVEAQVWSSGLCLLDSLPQPLQGQLVAAQVNARQIRYGPERMGTPSSLHSAMGERARAADRALSRCRASLLLLSRTGFREHPWQAADSTLQRWRTSLP